MVQYIFVVLYKNQHLLNPLKSAVSKWSAMMSIQPTWRVRGDAGQPAHFKQFSWTITLHSEMKWKIVWRVFINLCDINPWPVLVLTHGFLKPELQDLLSLNLTIFSLENKRFRVSPNIIVSVKSGRCLTQFWNLPSTKYYIKSGGSKTIKGSQHQMFCENHYCAFAQ